MFASFGQLALVLAILVSTFALLCNSQGRGHNGALKRHDEEESWWESVRPNPYQSDKYYKKKPYKKGKYRAPYYDKWGNGKLLYGYGSGKLIHYSGFKPLEGYY